MRLLFSSNESVTRVMCNLRRTVLHKSRRRLAGSLRLRADAPTNCGLPRLSQWSARQLRVSLIPSADTLSTRDVGCQTFAVSDVLAARRHSSPVGGRAYCFRSPSL